MKFIKEHLIFFIFIILMCIIGGYFTVIYSLQSVDQNMIEEAVNQIGSKELLIGISVAQISLYAIIFAGIGMILCNKIGLWKNFKINKKAIIGVSVIAIVVGLLLSIGDRYIFGSFIDPVLHSYDNKPTIEYIIASFTYGGVFEEILMRLFLMSLISWIISKIFYRKQKEIPTKLFVIANILSALSFAAIHLPSTIQIFGYIDWLIALRCMLMNGAFGLAFGWIYRKYGIQYAMLAHFGCHLISKIIWLIFI